MIRFLLSFAVVGTGLLVWNLPSGHGRQLLIDGSPRLMTLFIFVPLLSAWITLGAALYVRPTRLFNTKAPPKLVQVFLGFSSGLVSMILAVCGTVLLDRTLGDIPIMILSSIIGTSVIVRLSRTIRPGHCARCDYDLRSSIAFGRCPECGLAL